MAQLIWIAVKTHSKELQADSRIDHIRCMRFIKGTTQAMCCASSIPAISGTKANRQIRASVRRDPNSSSWLLQSTAVSLCLYPTFWGLAVIVCNVTHCTVHVKSFACGARDDHRLQHKNDTVSKCNYAVAVVEAFGQLETDHLPNTAKSLSSINSSQPRGLAKLK